MRKSPTAPKTTGFVKPTIEQVETFMNIKKPEWPAVFARYYADRFWNHYQSNGWKISGRAAMKDWKSAICAQWIILKYREDKEYLEKCLKSVEHRIEMDKRTHDGAGMFIGQEERVSPSERMIQRIEEIFGAHRAGTAKEEELQWAAGLLQRNKILTLPREQILRIREMQGNDGDYGRLLAIRQFFNNLSAKGLSFGEFFKAKFQSAQI